MKNLSKRKIVEANITINSFLRFIFAKKISIRTIFKY